MSESAVLSTERVRDDRKIKAETLREEFADGAVWAAGMDPSDAEISAVLGRLNLLDPGRWNWDMALSLLLAARDARLGRDHA